MTFNSCNFVSTVLPVIYAGQSVSVTKKERINLRCWKNTSLSSFHKIQDKVMKESEDRERDTEMHTVL
jgi:hypothetical protein